jgi:hypothetical protein
MLTRDRLDLGEQASGGHPSEDGHGAVSQAIKPKAIVHADNHQLAVHGEHRLFPLLLASRARLSDADVHGLV